MLDLGAGTLLRIKTMPEISETICRFISAYNALNVEEMMHYVTDDVEFQYILNGEITAHTHSKKAFEDLAIQGASVFKRRNQTVIKFISVSNMTLMEISYEAIVAADLPNGWKAGQEISYSGSSAYILRNNKIMKIIDQT